MPDFTLEIVRSSDEATPTRAGDNKRERVVTFYLGKFGPFTERWPLDEFSDADFTARVAKLRTTLDNMHRA